MSEVMSTSQAASDYKAVSVDGKRDKYVRERIVNPYLQSPSGPLRFSGSSIGVAGVSSPPIAKASEVRQEVTSVVPDSDKDWSGFVVANFPNEESGGHVGVGLGFGEEDFHFRGGVSVFSSDKTYLGFDFGGRLTPFGKLSPFVGFGGYIGDAKECEVEDVGAGYFVETCEKFFLATAYPEIGIRWEVESGTSFSLFARDYSSFGQEIQDGATRMYGVSVDF